MTISWLDCKYISGDRRAYLFKHLNSQKSQILIKLILWFHETHDKRLQQIKKNYHCTNMLSVYVKYVIYINLYVRFRNNDFFLILFCIYRFLYWMFIKIWKVRFMFFKKEKYLYSYYKEIYILLFENVWFAL